MAAALGYRSTLAEVGLPDWPLRVESEIGARPSTERNGPNGRRQVFPAAYAPAPGSTHARFEHLEFALKYEGVDLAALAAVFERTDAKAIGAWIASKPTSKYARRLGHLYEILTDRQIDLDGIAVAGPYEPLLDEAIYYTGRARNCKRWHTRDNLPGDRRWCPIVHRKDFAGAPVASADFGELLRQLRARTPPAVFDRALSYAYLAETQSSYRIETDTPTPTQRHAFARALAEAGAVSLAQRLTDDALAELQAIIFGDVPTFTVPGLRGEDIFVGHFLPNGLRRVDFPCPPARALPELLAGLSQASVRTLEARWPPSVLAAAVSYGFVFQHPLRDGNGRVHRFLIHEALVECGSLASGALIPVSVAMLARLDAYRKSLETYSVPVARAAHKLAGLPLVLEATEPFRFDRYEAIAPLYRYPVLTEQAVYLDQTLREAVDEHLHREARFLQQFDAARDAARQRLNLPDDRLDLLIHCIRQNGGRLSTAKRASHFDDLTPVLLEAIEADVREAFDIEADETNSARRA